MLRCNVCSQASTTDCWAWFRCGLCSQLSFQHFKSKHYQRKTCVRFWVDNYGIKHNCWKLTAEHRSTQTFGQIRGFERPGFSHKIYGVCRSRPQINYGSRMTWTLIHAGKAETRALLCRAFPENLLPIPLPFTGVAAKTVNYSMSFQCHVIRDSYEDVTLIQKRELQWLKSGPCVVLFLFSDSVAWQTGSFHITAASVAGLLSNLCDNSSFLFRQSCIRLQPQKRRRRPIENSEPSEVLKPLREFGFFMGRRLRGVRCDRYLCSISWYPLAV